MYTANEKNRHAGLETRCLVRLLTETVVCLQPPLRVHSRAIITMEREQELVYAVYGMVPFAITLSDIECLGKIFNDMKKHRAASLGQLSFL